MDRRHVITRGARLAYGTPLLVATVKLTEQRVSACSPGPRCGPCEFCSDVSGECERIPWCIPPK